MTTKQEKQTGTNGNGKQPEISAAKLNEELNTSKLTGDPLPVTTEEAFKVFENADEKELVELTSEYFNFKTPGVYHFIFEGMTTATLDGKVCEAVRLRDKAERTLLNANAVLVNSCKKIESIPAYIRVEYIGDVKAAGGTYKNLKVSSFPVK